MLHARSHHYLQVLLVSASLILSSCAAHIVNSRRPASHSTFFQPQGQFGEQDATFIDDNCGLFGMPELVSQWPHGPTAFVIREGYVLQHSSEDKIARWVCEHVTKDEVSGTEPRRDRFAPDPQLAGKPRSELSDYRRSGFDRGHAAPAGNQNSSARLKEETFFLSNMSPQKGVHNQQIWAELEHLVRSWVDNNIVDSEVVVTGGFFYDPREEDPATADGLIDYQTIGTGAVAVPTHYYKIVLAQNHAGEWQAVAFVQENRGYPRPFNFAGTIKPIAWIEERTGIDFFPDLDPIERQRLETQPGTLFQ